MAKVLIKCWACQGRGRVELTGVYADTLRILRASRSAVVANRDADRFGCLPTALNNRLSWLEEHGLAQSVRHGRERRFWAT